MPNAIALSSIRVLDLSDAIGAHCSRVLADLGADVVKVEPPCGDDLRRRPPFAAGDGRQPESLVFAAYHANKRGITLDCTDPASLPLLGALARDCDVIMASPTARRPVAGFDRDGPTVSWARPDAIVASITPFGLTGPWRDLRMTAFLSYAMGGGMHPVGHPDGPPLGAPGQLAWDEACVHAAFGIIVALSVRDRVGGQLLDLSVHEVAAAKDFLLERYDVGGSAYWGRKVGVGYPPTGVWECADGPLSVAAHQRHHWPAFLAMLGNPEELSDPSYEDPLFRRQVFDLLEELIVPLMARSGRLELFARGQAHGLPCAPDNTPGDFVADIQPRAREIFVAAGRTGSADPIIPWRWCRSSAPLLELRRPAPLLGEHNQEVYIDELGFTGAQLESWREAGIV